MRQNTVFSRFKGLIRSVEQRFPKKMREGSLNDFLAATTGDVRVAAFAIPVDRSVWRVVVQCSALARDKPRFGPRRTIAFHEFVGKAPAPNLIAPTSKELQEFAQKIGPHMIRANQEVIPRLSKEIEKNKRIVKKIVRDWSES